MSDVERLAAAVVAFLRSEAAIGSVTPIAAEGLSVAAQCLETSFALNERPPAGAPVDLLDLFRRHAPNAEGARPPPPPFVAASPLQFAFPAELFGGAAAALPTPTPPPPPPPPPERKAQADALKNEGNALMKSERFADALDKYTEAIAIDPSNAIFFCNRAAAHSSLKNNEAAIEDCRRALALNSKYGRAYGRLGLAFTNLNRHSEARDAYRIACQLEPNNEAYRNNLAVTEETLRQAPHQPPPSFAGVGVDLGSLLQNQTLASVATQMLSDPSLQNFMGRLLGDLTTSSPPDGSAQPGAAPPAGGLNALLQAGQQLAQQMQQANPELVEQLRQQISGQRPPSPQNEPPKPPQ